jgi:type I restriction enzyme M protein
MTLSKTGILDTIFRVAPAVRSEDDCAENIVIPFLERLGYQKAQIRRKVSIVGHTGVKFRKQADIVVYLGERPGVVVETKRLQHRLREEDANQVLAYAQLLSPPPPYAVLTNGRRWEVYRLAEEQIGGIEEFPEPDGLVAAVSQLDGIQVPLAKKLAAERLLTTLENASQLEEAFKKCRQALAKEGFIAESSFDELTKVLVCKFNEEKNLGEGLGAYRFSMAWLKGEGPLEGLRKMFVDAKQRFRVFPPGNTIQIRNNETVEEIVKALEPFGFYGFKTPLGIATAGGDIIGSVYETFLTGTLRGDLGQYLTPRQIVEFMAELAEIQIGYRVLDLACGSGGFLIGAFLAVRKKIRSLKTSQADRDHLVADLVSNCLWGVEINARLATLCRINMILHGDGYEHLYSGDSIRDNVFENTEGRRIDLSLVETGEIPKFDVILMNPPFNLPYEDSQSLNRYELGRGHPSQGSDYLMLERALRLLREETGRLLIIMPHGVASGTSEREVRNFIKEKGRIIGCVSLPVGCFKPFGGSNARTCVLLLSTPSHPVDPSTARFLAACENVGFDTTSKYYAVTDQNDLPEIADAFLSKESTIS